MRHARFGHTAPAGAGATGRAGPHPAGLVYALVLAGLMLAVTARALPALAGTTETNAPVALRSTIEVEGRYVTLGDIFHPLSGETDLNVARAPEPGEKLTLEAVWLWRLARRHGIDWRPTSKLDTATVIRPSRVVPTERLRGLVRQAYFERTGDDELIEIALDQGDARLHLARDAGGTASLRQFSLDRASGRFKAVVAGPDTPEGQRSVTLTGRAVRLVELPAPVGRIGSGTIIRARDLETVRLPASKVSGAAVVDAGRLIGLEAQRALAAGRPIQTNSVAKPELVGRDSNVTIVLQTENMRLTTQGRAMQAGAMDEIVRVQNLQSRITIDAVVTGENRVSVVTPERLAANDAGGACAANGE